MQLCDVTVRHAGRLDMTVRKCDVTPAEIAILRRIHGDDAVVEISKRRIVKRAQDYELDRLRFIYRPARADEPHPVDILWPGVNKSLPVNLEDIGIKTGSPFLGQPPKSLSEEEVTNNFFAPADLDDDEGEGDAEPAAGVPPAAPAKAAEPTKAA